MDALKTAFVEPALDLHRIAAELERSGYAIVPGGLPGAVATELLAYAADTERSDFRPAAIGRGSEEQENRFIRRDHIHWLNEKAPELSAWRAWTEELRLALNRQLFLGLFSFESHLARYRVGDFYRKHVDAFRGEANRVVSLVTYLNDGWQTADGGELVLYTEAGEVSVLPAARTVVLFLSEEMPHEVRPANRERLSVAGWFRLNASSPDRVDPPR